MLAALLREGLPGGQALQAHGCALAPQLVEREGGVVVVLGGGGLSDQRVVRGECLGEALIDEPYADGGKVAIAALLAAVAGGVVVQLGHRAKAHVDLGGPDGALCPAEVQGHQVAVVQAVADLVDGKSKLAVSVPADLLLDRVEGDAERVEVARAPVQNRDKVDKARAEGSLRRHHVPGVAGVDAVVGEHKVKGHVVLNVVQDQGGGSEAHVVDADDGGWERALVRLEDLGADLPLDVDLAVVRDVVLLVVLQEELEAVQGGAEEARGEARVEGVRVDEAAVAAGGKGSAARAKLEVLQVVPVAAGRVGLGVGVVKVEEVQVVALAGAAGVAVDILAAVIPRGALGLAVAAGLAVMAGLAVTGGLAVIAGLALAAWLDLLVWLARGLGLRVGAQKGQEQGDQDGKLCVHHSEEYGARYGEEYFLYVGSKHRPANL